jgi:hypothetical protein
MKCPKLVKQQISSCKAGDKPYMPSKFQLQYYCKNPEHKKCPFYASAYRGLEALSPVTKL